MACMTKVGKKATKVFTEDNETIVRYHRTDVVKFNKDYIILNSGGWLTITTKTRMNQASNQYKLGFYVFQKNHEWFVDHKGNIFNFFDGMYLER